MCVICQQAMSPEEELEALPCMHLFHKGCVDDWRAATAKPVNHCPLKCHVTAAVIIEGSGAEAEGQPESPTEAPATGAPSEAVAQAMQDVLQQANLFQ